jgi:hypothetical protein
MDNNEKRITRSGALAVPESWQHNRSLEKAAMSLEAHYEGNPKTKGNVLVSAGADKQLVLHVFMKDEIEIPDTWEGYPVRISGSQETAIWITHEKLASKAD